MAAKCLSDLKLDVFSTCWQAAAKQAERKTVRCDKNRAEKLVLLLPALLVVLSGKQIASKSGQISQPVHCCRIQFAGSSDKLDA